MIYDYNLDSNSVGIKHKRTIKPIFKFMSNIGTILGALILVVIKIFASTILLYFGWKVLGNHITIPSFTYWEMFLFDTCLTSIGYKFRDGLTNKSDD